MPDTIDDVDEHPIIFNDWSIKRILAREKTQTRRVVKLDSDPDDVRIDPVARPHGPPKKWDVTKADQPIHLYQIQCPYGQPGDFLWVREAFRLPAVNDEVSPSDDVGAGCDVWRYESDGAIHDPGGWTNNNEYEWGRKRPSIHMPRELCRLRLRVEDVRVERVQEITIEDCVAEGVDPQGLGYKNGRRHPKPSFKPIWNDIHGDGAWERNDWVWVVSFSRIDDK